jgi:chemotaxis protein methyltransferase CheR
MTLPKQVIENLNQFIAARTGLFFTEKRYEELEKKITTVSREFGFEQTEDFIDWLIAGDLTRPQIEILASHLTVTETYFFRDKHNFEILEKSILPELINAKRNGDKRLRIWCAGCSSGEEPYTIAIILKEQFKEIEDWNVSILATDINPQALKKATEGKYSRWSFRDTPPWVIDRYFTREKENLFALDPAIKKMVTFTYLNLAEDVYPSLCNATNAMDLIFCRNVLMYFAPEVIRVVTERFYRTILDRGWLIVNPVEITYLNSSSFIPVHLQKSTVFRKDPAQLKTLKKVPGIFEVIPPFAPAISATNLQPPSPIPESPATDYFKKEEAVPITPLWQFKSSPPEPKNEINTDQQKVETTAPGELPKGQFDQIINLQNLITLTRTYADQGQLEEARRTCEAALNLDICRPELHYLYSSILLELNLTGEAITSLHKSLYLDPDFILAHFTLGILNQRLGKPTETRRHFRNALNLLTKLPPDTQLPESDGITAGRLAEIITINSTQGDYLAIPQNRP